MAISAKQVMELRKKSGAGIMDAKKALVASDGDMDKAMDFLREKGIAKAAKKSDRIAAEGLTDIKVEGNTAAIVELNSETDFVAASDPFKDALKSIASLLVEKKPADVEAALALETANGTLNDDLIATTQKTGEKVSLRRFTLVEKADGDSFGAYLHQGGRIAALVVLEGADETTAKDVAMHVAAVNPEFMTREDVPAERLEHEKKIFTEETLNEGKPEKIVGKIVEGRLNKFLAQITLADQAFVKDSDQTVAEYVASKGGKLKSFIRYEVGEGIEKKETNLAQEISEQLNK
ncbi:translation elongation factor Ts [Limosilactobacillus ingluviei]|uniref:Elongation factor Ts n=1 Tax=Limosilactobacillus ingluviei TaxID=148604 RepID=A0A0R2GYQ5_9LACO|nr:translation elongation factor Ts [Limosilactobacillus ingluviei]KRN45438.1 Elongation factor Ts (EF-Ts) [Limosilactobacillus ingluviei]MDO4602979.1 translation elongation factor Ts [Limosilactobacillus ingluviei]HJG49514.1 translation elongation factor Ts [Limosilactobacillus ingluviei]